MINREVFKAVFHVSPDINLLYSVDGRILDCNENACQAFGYKRSEMLEMCRRDLTSDDYVALLPEVMTEKDTTRGVFVWRSGKKKDGTIFPIEYSNIMIRVDGETYVYACIRCVNSKYESAFYKMMPNIASYGSDELLPSFFTVNLTWMKRDDDFILIGYDASAEESTKGRVADYLGSSARDLYADRPGIAEDLELCMSKKSMVQRERYSYQRFTTGEIRFRDINYIYVFPDIVVAHMKDITERELAEARITESERELRILSSKLFLAKEDERKRISQELHDGICQQLTGIKFNLERTINDVVSGNLEVSIEELKRNVLFIKSAIEELRKTCMNLWPSTLSDLGILATLSWLCRECMEVNPELYVASQIDLSEDDIPERIKVSLYRIVQEAMNNVIKHSHADTVELVLRKDANAIELVLSDNGIGFNVSDVVLQRDKRRGLGLASIRDRAETTGGRCLFDSISGSGTTIKVIWTSPI